MATGTLLLETFSSNSASPDKLLVMDNSYKINAVFVSGYNLVILKDIAGSIGTVTVSQTTIFGASSYVWGGVDAYCYGDEIHIICGIAGSSISGYPAVYKYNWYDLGSSSWGLGTSWETIQTNTENYSLFGNSQNCSITMTSDGVPFFACMETAKTKGTMYRFFKLYHRNGGTTTYITDYGDSSTEDFRDTELNHSGTYASGTLYLTYVDGSDFSYYRTYTVSGGMGTENSWTGARENRYAYSNVHDGSQYWYFALDGSLGVDQCDSTSDTKYDTGISAQTYGVEAQAVDGSLYVTVNPSGDSSKLNLYTGSQTSWSLVTELVDEASSIDRPTGFKCQVNHNYMDSATSPRVGVIYHISNNLYWTYYLIPQNITVSLSAASLTATGQTITPSTVSDLTVSLSAASLTATGQTLTVERDLSVSLGAASLTATGQTLSVSTTTYLGEIWNENIESGTLSGFNYASAGCSASATAALAGTNYGLLATVTADSQEYVRKAITNHDTNKLSFRFYFNVDNYTLPSTESFQVGRVNCDGTYGGNTRLVYVVIYGGTGKECRVYWQDDDGTGNLLASVTNLSGDYYIEVSMTRETADGQADGTIDWKLNGTPQTGASNLDNYNTFFTIDNFYAGAYITSGTGSSEGDVYADEFIMRDDGAWIGPVISDVTVSLNAASLTAIGQALTVQRDLSVSLSQATLAATGQTLSVQRDLSVALNNAALTATGQILDVREDLSVALNQASLTATGQILSVQRDLSVDLSVASLIATGQTFTVQRDLSVSLNQATLTATGQILSVQRDLSVSLSVASLTATGQTLTVQRDLSVSLDQATITATGQTLTPRARIKTSLNQASLTATGQTLSVQRDLSINLNQASLTATGQALTVGVDLSVSLSVATLTATGQTLTVLKDLSVALNQATMTLVGQILDVREDLSVTLNQATLTLLGQILDVREDLSVSLDQAVLTVIGQTLDVREDLSASLFTATLTATGQALSVQRDLSVSLSTANLTVTGQTLYPAVVTGILLQSATLTANAQTLSVVAHIIRTLNQATLTLLGQTLDVREDLSVTLNAAALTATGQTLDVREDAGVTLSAATLTLTGQTLDVITNVTVSLSTANMTATGQSASPVVIVGILLGEATLTVTGQSINVKADTRVFLNNAVMTATPQTADAITNITLLLSPAQITASPQTLEIATYILVALATGILSMQANRSIIFAPPKNIHDAVGPVRQTPNRRVRRQFWRYAVPEEWDKEEVTEVFDVLDMFEERDKEQ